MQRTDNNMSDISESDTANTADNELTAESELRLIMSDSISEQQCIAADTEWMQLVISESESIRKRNLNQAPFGDINYPVPKRLQDAKEAGKS